MNKSRQYRKLTEKDYLQIKIKQQKQNSVIYNICQNTS